jgi:D-xylose 1-dehydrogenase (NADP+, D-xylono-1,5-lactone-forming)
MTGKIRWGILGTANIAYRRIVPAIQSSRNGVVTAVASRSLEKAQTFAAEKGIPTAHGSYEALLADPNIDAIYNPLPNSEHALWSIRAAEAGKPVLCEKPLASDAAEAGQIVDAFARHKLLLAEGFMYRFHPQTLKVKAMVESGAVGEVQQISASFTFALRSDENIRLSKALAGGGLMDVGCYPISLMRLLTGEEPSAVRALARIGQASEVDENLAGVLMFPSGVIGHFDCGVRAFRCQPAEVRGTTGRIVLEKAFTMEPNEQPVIRWWHGEEYEEITLPAVNHYSLMFEAFGDALLEGKTYPFSPADAVANMRVIDQLRAAALGA